MSEDNLLEGEKLENQDAENLNGEGGESASEGADTTSVESADDSPSDREANIGGESALGDGEPEGGNSVPSWKDDPDYKDYISDHSSDNSDNSDGEFKKIPVEEYNALVEDANNWRSFQSDEVAMAVVGHINGGGRIEDLVSQFDTRDYSKLSPEELFEIDIRSNPDFTEEDIQEAVSDFDNESSYRKKQIAYEIRQKLSNRKNNNGQGLVSAYKNKLDRHTKIVEKFNVDYEGELEKWKKKGYFFDVPVTDDVVQEMRRFVKETNGMIFSDKDGNIDAKKFFQAVFSLKYLPKIAEAKQVKGAVKATEKYIREHQNAGSSPDKPGGEIPSNVETKKVDWGKEYRKMFQGKNKRK